MGDPVAPEVLSLVEKSVMRAIAKDEELHSVGSLNWLIGRGFVQISLTDAGRRALEGERHA